MGSLLQWSKGEQNQVFGQIFGKIAELNWMWEKTIEKFVEQVWINVYLCFNRIRLTFCMDKRISVTCF